MALSQFDLAVGGQKGNKMLTGKITTVNDNYTIASGLTDIIGVQLSPVGMVVGMSRVVPISTTGGNIVVSVTNSVGASLTVVVTVFANITGY